MSAEEQVTFEFSFKRAVKVTPRDDRLSSAIGALLLGEADRRAGTGCELASA